MNGQRRPSSPRSSTSSQPLHGIVAQHISDEIKAAIKSTTPGISENLVQIRRFLPKGDLQTILNLQILKSYLWELFGDIVEPRKTLKEGVLTGGGHEPTGLDKLIDNALTLITGDTARGIPSRRALLALFLYQRRTGLLAIFKSWLLSQQTDFPSDDDLPFSQQSLEEARIPDRYSEYFRDYQSIFTPVVLKQGRNQTFTSNHRLPYIGTHLTEQEGSSGIVYTRKVAPYHWEVQLSNGGHTPDETVNPTILALKVFNGGLSRQEARADFEIERKILEDLRNSNITHKMILLHWGSITIQDEQGPPIEHSLIFECATYSLEEFLMGEKGVETAWVASQLLAKLADIVQALTCLHDNFDTLHLDIKPDNILVFVKASTGGPDFDWKISDFGLARKRNAKPRAGHLLDLNRSTSRSASVLATRNAGRYQAPEIQQRNASKAGQKSDVWSMGCVALMVLGFAINGSTMVTDLTHGLQVEYKNATGFDSFFYVTNDSYQW
ncbi:kinase-like domain-containing protein, partial [Phaeosphaeria sp. MPI-PUGE-AT-0046c]